MVLIVVAAKAWSGVYSMVLSEESAESRKFKQKQNGDDHVGE